MKIKYRYGSPIKRAPAGLGGTRPSPWPSTPTAASWSEMSGRHNVASLAEAVKGKTPEEAAEEFRRFGRKVMASTIELADGKYLDRTGEMIEKVAEQTGIHFPHRLQRYVELSIIGPRPLDRWNVAVSTLVELRMQVFSCSLLKALQDAGVPTEGTPCREFCLASFRVAAEKCGLETQTTPPGWWWRPASSMSTPTMTWPCSHAGRRLQSQQGVTTEVIGNCGTGAAPATAAYLDYYQMFLAESWARSMPSLGAPRRSSTGRWRRRALPSTWPPSFPTARYASWPWAWRTAHLRRPRWRL